MDATLVCMSLSFWICANHTLSLAIKAQTEKNHPSFYHLHLLLNSLPFCSSLMCIYTSARFSLIDKLDLRLVFAKETPGKEEPERHWHKSQVCMKTETYATEDIQNDETTSYLNCIFSPIFIVLTHLFETNYQYT